MADDHIDRILDSIDSGLQSTGEASYGTGRPGVCWRCNVAKAGEGPSGVCERCRRILLGELEDVPAWLPSPVWEGRREPSRGLRAFGGPINGQIVAVDSDHYLVAVQQRLSYAIDEPLDPTAAVSFETVRYTVERFAYGDDRGLWIGRCLVAAGYDRQQITDALNAVRALASIRWAVRTGGMDG